MGHSSYVHSSNTTTTTASDGRWCQWLSPARPHGGPRSRRWQALYGQLLVVSECAPPSYIIHTWHRITAAEEVTLHTSSCQQHLESLSDCCCCCHLPVCAAKTTKQEGKTVFAYNKRPDFCFRHHMLNENQKYFVINNIVPDYSNNIWSYTPRIQRHAPQKKLCCLLCACVRDIIIIRPIVAPLFLLLLHPTRPRALDRLYE